MSGAQVLRELLDHADRLADGRLADPAVDATQERFVVRVPAAAAVDLRLLPTGPVVTRVHAQGDVVATDRRLLVLEREQVRAQWSWQSDVSELTLLPHGVGVALAPSPERHAAGVRTVFGAVTARVLVQPPARPEETVPLGLLWFMVESAWWASRGELDGWRERVQALVAR